MAVDSLVTSGGGIVVHRGLEGFSPLKDSWDRLSERSPSPFVTHGWLDAWWRSFGKGELLVPALHAADGRLRAAATFTATAFGGLAATANDHSGDWDAVAEDEEARAELWAGIAGLGVRHVTLSHLRATAASAGAARRALAPHGFRFHATPANRSPYLELPDSHDALMAAQSKNLRSQVGRRRRQLEREGALAFRLTTGGPGLDADLDRLFEVEASGWKAREGTAILREPGAEPLYRRFARALAERGALRVYLLELDGRLLAGDLGCALGDTGFLIKTGFDEAWSRLSPGLVLRSEVLRSSIEEGLRGYDFLGPDDAYKLRWTPLVRPRVVLRGFRGAATVPGAAWYRGARPVLKRARDELAARRASAGGAAPGPDHAG